MLLQKRAERIQRDVVQNLGPQHRHDVVDADRRNADSVDHRGDRACARGERWRVLAMQRGCRSNRDRLRKNRHVRMRPAKASQRRKSHALPKRAAARRLRSTILYCRAHFASRQSRRRPSNGRQCRCDRFGVVTLDGAEDQPEPPANAPDRRPASSRSPFDRRAAPKFLSRRVRSPRDACDARAA